MKTTSWYVTMVALGIAGLAVAGQARSSAQPNTGPAIGIGSSDLGGVGTGPRS